MSKLVFKVETFEGPLDALLHLISKHKLNIYDISISELLAQYLNYMDELRRTNLEIASEFLEMAARLVYIKSAMLLPKYENEAEDLKRELTGELIEYELCKKTAGKLGEIYMGNVVFVREPEPIEVDRSYQNFHESLELYRAYEMANIRIRRRLPPKQEEFSGIVERPVVSVTAKIISILRRLVKRDSMKYDKVFDKSRSRGDMVATFLGLLELVRAGRVKFSEDNKRVHAVREVGK